MLAPGHAIRIELSGEPKGKGRPRFVRKSGIAFTPADTRNYEAALRYAAQEVMGSLPPLDVALTVIVRAFFPIPKAFSRKKREQAQLGAVRPCTKPDADNILKLSDALNQVVWADDKQIVEARIFKFYSDRPRLTIEVEPARMPLFAEGDL